MLHSIDVRLHREEEYRIHLGMNIWEAALNYFSTNFSEHKIFVVMDEKVHGLHGEKIKSQCQRYFKTCECLTIPEGEQSKSVARWEELQDTLIEKGVERGTPMLAAGGGVTGDLAGFAAASVLRGIPLVHMPTSLLAMVDSSIGGKTGVNHPAGKNLIGAFYQPDAVFIDLNYLETLERREWIDGLSEMLKYAAIRRPELFDGLAEAVREGFSPSDHWLELIRQSAAIKVKVVEEDEREAGIRAHLNFGHTFGHALEKLAGFGNISHGEAVFVGMLAALHYSKVLGAPVGQARFDRFKPLYDINLPTEEQIPTLIEAMRTDKKVVDGTIRLVLLDDWGRPHVKGCQDESRLEDAWRAALNAMNI